MECVVPLPKTANDCLDISAILIIVNRGNVHPSIVTVQEITLRERGLTCTVHLNRISV
jgi:hypothetical protein